MHKRTHSVDSTYNIRKNPLNIRNLDGTDIVLDRQAKLAEEVLEHKGTVKSSVPRTAAAGLRRPQSAVFVREEPSDDLYLDKITESELLPEVRNIVKLGEPNRLHDSDSTEEDYRLSVHISSPEDLSLSVMKSYSSLRPKRSTRLSVKPPSGVEVGRKNTITTNKDVIVHPSQQLTEIPFDNSCSASATSRELAEHSADDEMSSTYSESIGSFKQIRSPTMTEDIPCAPSAHQGLTPQTSPIDPSDRGRLFLKISGLCDLKMPLDRAEKPSFSLILDNGIQCVTTYPIAFGKGVAEIDQEFELVVGDDLELDITLEAHRSREAAKTPEPKLAKGSVDASKKKTKLGRLFKRSDSKSKIEVESEPEPEAKDVWKGIVGKKGEFAHTSIVHSSFEKDIYGRPQEYNLSCYNHWAKQKAPYRVCGLQVTMIYLPKLYREEELPSSLDQSVKDINSFFSKPQEKLSGYLSQQGGDCSYYRRRWFELTGSRLVGHHDETKQVRCTFDMDLVAKVTDAKDDPSVYEDRAFKVGFKDGSSIMFLADSIDTKCKWFDVLMGKSINPPSSWLDLVKIQREQKALASKASRKQLKVQLSKSGSSSFIESC